MVVFKTGDKIRCLENSSSVLNRYTGYIKGEIYEVKYTHLDTIYTKRDSKGSTTNGWGSSHFELVKPKRSKNLPAWW